MAETETIVVEFAPGMAGPVLARYAHLGATDPARLDNISRMLHTDIWVMEIPPGIPRDRLVLPGVLALEGELEHAFFASQASHHLLHTSPALPGKNQFQIGMPFGIPDLRLGSPVTFDYFAAQGSLDNLLRLIDAPDAWKTNRGQGATIVVIDTGIDGSLVPSSRRAGGWAGPPGSDPWVDSNGHGSMVAMIAAANPGINGYAGVAPEAKLYSIKAKTGPSGGILGTSVLKGLDHVLGLGLGPVVVNCSWGVFGCVSSDVVCKVIPARLVAAIQRGAVTVWAAGNSRGLCKQDERLLWCLNSLPNSVSVAALNGQLRPQPYSTPGPGQCSPEHPTISAPTVGALPWGTGFIDQGLQGGGTSSTAPMVSGAMAILLTAFPGASVSALKHAIQRGALPLSARGAGWDKDVGWGMLRVSRALAEMEKLAQRKPALVG